MTEPGRLHHDMGGLPGDAIDRSQHDKAMWEKRIDALVMLLGHKDRQLVRVDELRRGIEQLGADIYERLGYYERWTASVAHILLEKGVIEADELGRKMAEIEARLAAEGGK